MREDPSREAVRRDLLVLVALTLVLVGTGIGLRDPWPADEPRFALIARDMAASGQWLIPQIGGDLYADKPPLFFWIVGGLFKLTGSLSVALLLPGLIAALGCVVLVYDLARRVWDREVALAAGLGLLATLQFVWQMRQGQIDATLCLFTTLSLYGLLRHLLVGPAWAWYWMAWMAAGFGVITKGVGFLPLLVLLPYGLMRWRQWLPSAPPACDWRWWVGPLAMLAAISVWLAPMLIAAANHAELTSYRDQILFQQTVQRYANAWHHREPFYYYVLQVIPALWLPLIAWLPWLAPHWRRHWHARDARVWLPLSWVLIVVVFFSLSTGKRGLYIVPATPAFVLACAPWLRTLAQSRGPNRVLFALALGLALLALVAYGYLFLSPTHRATLLSTYEINSLAPLAVFGVAALLICTFATPQRGVRAFGAVLVSALLMVSFWVNPLLNDVRSGKAFVRRVEQHVPRDVELGLVGYKEQYLLYFQRPTINFGHARWRDAYQEAADGAAWLGAKHDRMLLVNRFALQACFQHSKAQYLAQANRQSWYLVSGPSDPGCRQNGHLNAARRYVAAHP